MKSFSILLVMCLVCEVNAQCGSRVSFDESFGSCDSYQPLDCDSYQPSGCDSYQPSGCGSYQPSGCEVEPNTENTFTIPKSEAIEPTNTFTIPKSEAIEPTNTFTIPKSEAIEPATLKIKLRVPNDAVITINGKQTRQIGELRSYSVELQPDKRYRFVIHVQVFRGNELLTETKTLFIKGQRMAELAFDPQPSANTALAAK